MFEIDLTKFKKYDKPGPRYTSYPTAPHFSDSFTAENYLDEIIKTNYGENLPDLSLYLSSPFLRHALLFLRMQYDHNP